MQKINFGQAHKENQNHFQQSPNKKRKGQVLIQILKYLKNNSITLPAHIHKLLSQSNPIGSQSPLKVASNNIKQQPDNKKLKIQLSQCQFQLKKIEEDFAQFKRTIKNEKQKQAKKSEQNLSKLKNQIQNINQDRTYLIDKQKKQYQNQIKIIKQKNKLQREQQITIINDHNKKNIQNQQKIARRQINELHRTYHDKIKNTTEKYQEQIYKLKIGHQHQIKDAAMKNKFLLQQRQRKYQSTKLALESQRKTQQKLHQKTKLQANKQKQKLITQLCYSNNIKKQLQQQIQANLKQIKRLKTVINDLQITLELKEQKFKRKFQQFQHQLNQKYKIYQNQQKQAIIKMNQAQIKEIQMFQQRLIDMQKIHNEKQEFLAKNTEQLATYIDKRPSKKQDISQIEKLKWALTKRQDQIRKLSREVKNCNLQLENKEDIYTRMFRGNSLSRQKKYTSKDERQKQQIIIEEKLIGKDPAFRKSHTSDLKFLLKVYTNKCNNKLD